MAAPDVHDFVTLGTASALHACATSRSLGLVCWGRDNVGDSVTDAPLLPPLWMCQNGSEIPDTMAIECQDDHQVCLLAPGGKYTVVGSEDRPECAKIATFADYTFSINTSVCRVTTFEHQGGTSQVDMVRLEMVPTSGRGRALAAASDADVTSEVEAHREMQCSCVRSSDAPTDSSSTHPEDTANLAVQVVYPMKQVWIILALILATVSFN